jgi:hypothetical protein
MEVKVKVKSNAPGTTSPDRGGGDPCASVTLHEADLQLLYDQNINRTWSEENHMN